MKMTLAELLAKKEVLMKMYGGVTEFSRVVEIEEKVIEPLERILKAYNKKKQPLVDRAKDDPEGAEKAHRDLLSEEIDVPVIKVEKKDIEGQGLNVFEYRAIKEFIT